MKLRIPLFACLFVVLGGYLALTSITATTIESPEVELTPPSVDLAPHFAAFSGIWEGSQDRCLPSRLVVEKIHPNWATIVYTWTDHPTGSFKAGWARVRAKALPDGTLRWGYPGRFTVRLVDGGTSLEGKMEQGGSVSTFRMNKVGRLAVAQ